MRNLSWAVLLAAVSMVGCGSDDSPGGGGGGDPVAMCNEGADAVCQKVFACAEAMSFRDFFGTSQADCATSIKAECSANSANMACDPGETYHADKAAPCLNAIKAVSCAQLTSPLGATPAVCAEVCTGP